ncbi:hypothetical protein FB451DRAFT_731712 [Mycena latifolia]|nr:hypothetical protein FB451DRAFT_731712 [Mycena latifolia]
MSDPCILQIQSVSGIRWSPGFLEPKIPSLYVETSVGKVTLLRTATSPQQLATEWFHVVTLSRNRLSLSSTIAFEVFHENPTGKSPHRIGTAEIQVMELIDLADSAQGKGKGLDLYSTSHNAPEPVGILTVHFAPGTALASARRFMTVLGDIIPKLQEITRMPDVNAQVGHVLRMQGST